MSTPADTRERVLEAALSCIEREGLAATSVEDVARAASVSRATIYRHFPGGREQLVTETATWEVARFFARVEQTVAAEPDLAARLRLALSSGHRALDDHALLHRLLRTEPEAVLTELSVATDLVLELIIAYLADQLRGRAGGRPGPRPTSTCPRPPTTSGASTCRTSAPPAGGTSTTPPRSTASCAPSSWPASPQPAEPPRACPPESWLTWPSRPKQVSQLSGQTPPA